MSDGILGERRRTLEAEFFAKRDAERIRALREKLAEKAELEALATAIGIQDPEVLQHLRALELKPEIVAAIGIVPMIEVAWADGELDAKERKAVLAAAAAHGVPEGHPAHGVLDLWLESRPGPELRNAWKHYVEAVCEGMSAEARATLKGEILGHATAVAEATGGFLGLGSKVSKSERAVLDDLAAAFPA